MKDFQPNAVTATEAAEVLRKFKDHNKGVVIFKPSYTESRDWDSISAKWTNLIDPAYCSIRNIKGKIQEIYTKMRNLPEDEVLGDNSIAFVHKTDRNKEIPFYWTDMYIFLREAIKERKASEDYKSKVRELELQQEFVAKNKPKDQMLKEAEDRIKELTAELDEGSTASANATTEESA